MCSLIYNTAILYFAVVKFFHTLSCAKSFICYWLNKVPLFQDFGCSESGGNFSGMMSAMVDRTRMWGNITSRHLLLLINKLSFNLQSGTAFSTLHCRISPGWAELVHQLWSAGGSWSFWGGGWRWWCWILVMLDFSSVGRRINKNFISTPSQAISDSCC